MKNKESTNHEMIQIPADLFLEMLHHLKGAQKDKYVRETQKVIDKAEHQMNIEANIKSSKLKTMTQDEKIQYMQLALGMAGFNIAKENLDPIIRIYELVLKKKEKTRVEDVVQIIHKDKEE